METKVLSDKHRAELMNAVHSGGVFVTCGRQSPNIMVAHRGAVGNLWGRDVFMLPVRSSKYSYRIITNTGSFALNVPARDMRNEIAICDSLSGFTVNKFEALSLHPKRARSIDAYVLGECGLIAEYKVIAIIPPEAITRLDDDLFDVKTAHSLFVAELSDCYRLR